MLLKHQVLVIDKRVQLPFSFSVLEMVGGPHFHAYTKLWAQVLKVFYRDGHVFVETLFPFLPRWMSQ